MCMYIYTCICIYTHMYTHTCAHIYTHVCVCACVLARFCVCVRVRVKNDGVPDMYWFISSLWGFQFTWFISSFLCDASFICEWRHSCVIHVWMRIVRNMCVLHSRMNDVIHMSHSYINESHMWRVIWMMRHSHMVAVCCSVL